MVELIVTEKPAQAEKIATALADTKPTKKTVNKVKYYELKHKGKSILVGCAVGHLFGLAKKENGNSSYPAFNIEWKPKYEIDKNSGYTRNYANVLKQLAKRADKFTVATDYDIEGSVIGFNVIKFICEKKDARRMKFSTLTKDELIESYEKASKHLDFHQIEAGKTRHHLDWLYGINISNALMTSIKHATNRFRIMSSGRVQGPTLKLIVKKELEIEKFVPQKYWELFLEGTLNKKKIKAKHQKDRFTKKQDVQKILTKTKGKKAIVETVEKKNQLISPPVPFDLTTLQTEAYKTLRITPKTTSKIAQDLYTAGLISYPRTSSQKLPKSIGYNKIIKKLSKQTALTKICNSLLYKKSLFPIEGKKKDPAHPAIYPTGDIRSLAGQNLKLYSLIVRRFLATFGDKAKKEHTRVKIDVNKEKFHFSGSRVLEKGWYEIYGPFIKSEEVILPKINKGDEVKPYKLINDEKETLPPKRYSQASIIREMESKGLGTKGTRALIVDALYQRKYVDGLQVKATPLGIKLIQTLEKYSPEIIDEKLTKDFEKEMEKIIAKKQKEKIVIKKAEKVLTTILNKFKKNEKKIGKALLVATADENVIGDCPKCKEGKLRLRYGKFGPFIACDQYEHGCKTIFGVPRGALIKSSGKICDKCKCPKILIIRKGKRPQETCINKDCPTKKVDIPKTTKKCPKCKGKLVVRKSLYGAFYACKNYPKCKYTENIHPTKKKKYPTKKKTKS